MDKGKDIPEASVCVAACAGYIAVVAFVDLGGDGRGAGFIAAEYV
jgi:hypothetical protein